MAIDFSQVKAITIPEGSVTKITDSNGNILWQGVQSEGWHTIWEGNKTCSLTRIGTGEPVVSGVEKNFVQTIAGTGYTPKIRVTFSYSNTNTDYNNWKNLFLLNNSEKTNVSSPVTIEAVKDATFDFLGTSICFASCRSSDKKAIFGVGLKSNRNKNNNSINISLVRQLTTNISYDSNFTITFTVTKIEQYY